MDGVESSGGGGGVMNSQYMRGDWITALTTQIDGTWFQQAQGSIHYMLFWCMF